MIVIRWLLAGVGLLVVWQVMVRLARKWVHFPAPAIIGRFLDSDLRRAMQPAAALIQRSGLAAGMHVLEIGCGSGAYTLDAARVVGPHGNVVALDIQANMLRQLQRKLARAVFSAGCNILPILGSAYELPFADNSFDAIYMVTVLQEIPDRQRALIEARRVLAPGGVLAISEWVCDPDYPLRASTIRQGQQAGFVLDGAPGNFWTYTVRLRKA